MSELYSFDLESRYLIIRGEDNVITATWSQGGATVTPTPGTVRIFDSGGQDVLSATPFTVVSNVATYTLAAAVTEDLLLEQGWTVEWAGVGLPDGTTRTFVAEAALVRYVLAPPASQRDLYRRYSRLNPEHRSPMVSDLNLDDKLRDAWREIEDRLYRNGRRSELVMSPAQFRTPHRELALAMIFEDLRSANWEAYQEIAAELRAGFEALWSQLVFQYDADQDGVPDAGSTSQRAGAAGPVFLTSRGLNWGDE